MVGIQMFVIFILEAIVIVGLLTVWNNSCTWWHTLFDHHKQTVFVSFYNHSKKHIFVPLSISWNIHFPFTCLPVPFLYFIFPNLLSSISPLPLIWSYLVDNTHWHTSLQKHNQSHATLFAPFSFVTQYFHMYFSNNLPVIFKILHVY